MSVVVLVVVFEFGVMRCQPLRRALGFNLRKYESLSFYGKKLCSTEFREVEA
ncbi:hypothetical protein VCHE25_0216 [Vibrio cholerae HE-25]|nr:hypothetical protein VCHE25_0216 [Vibrio cholerae HE-25]